MNPIRQMFVALGLALVTAVAPAAPVLDQQNLPGNAGLNSNLSDLIWQQEVRAGVSGRLTALELFFGDANGTTQATRFFLNRGSGWQSDANDFVSTFTPVINATVMLDLSSALFDVQAGEVFIVGIEGLGPLSDCCSLRGNSDGYSQGRLYGGSSQGFSFNSSIDMAFRTFVDANTVPLPPTLALVGLALVAWVAPRRLKRTS